MTIVLLMTFLMSADNSKIITIRNYQDPTAASSEQYIGRPWVACFSKDGKLFLLDRDRTTVLVWDKEGKFLRAIGKKGSGPGELNTPNTIAVTDTELWVWETVQKVSIFSHDGTFKKALSTSGINPRLFAVEDSLVVTGEMRTDREGLSYSFNKVSLMGKKSGTIKSFKTEGFLTNYEGGNQVAVKAFAPDIDLARDENGNLYGGMSETSTLYLLKDGEISKEIQFTIPTSEPQTDDIELVNTMSFPFPERGGRYTLKDVGLENISFNFPMAYYTHFMVKGGKVLFLRTPLGAFTMGDGFRQGTWYVNDLKSGDPLDTGRFSFEEDTTVHLADGGRAVMFTPSDSGWDVTEISFKGF